MSDKKIDNQAPVKYNDFIFNYQFSRKISIGNYILTKKALFSITIIVVILYLHPEDKGAQLFAMLMVAVIAFGYLTTRLRHDSVLKTIPYDRWNDEKSDAVLLLSKISWAKKRLKEKRKKKKG